MNLISKLIEGGSDILKRLDGNWPSYKLIQIRNGHYVVNWYNDNNQYIRQDGPYRNRVIAEDHAELKLGALERRYKRYKKYK